MKKMVKRALATVVQGGEQSQTERERQFLVPLPFRDSRYYLMKRIPAVYGFWHMIVQEMNLVRSTALDTQAHLLHMSQRHHLLILLDVVLSLMAKILDHICSENR